MFFCEGINCVKKQGRAYCILQQYAIGLLQSMFLRRRESRQRENAVWVFVNYTKFSYICNNPLRIGFQSGR